jgi:Ion channel
MPTYFIVLLLLWKREIEKPQSPVYHEFKGLHHVGLASFIVSPGTILLGTAMYASGKEMESMFLALLLGAGMFLGSLLWYAVATALIVHLLVWLIRAGYTKLGFWRNVAFMLIVGLVTAATHLIQIALWAVAFLMVGEISTFEKALYCSAENYTALGYGDIILSERWRLLGPLEAINGLLLFGLSTAMMFAVLSRLITNRLHLQIGHLGQAAVNPDPPVDGWW